MLNKQLDHLDQRKNLSYEDVSLVMTEILSGNASTLQIAEFLSKLADKGETDVELLGMLDKMFEFAITLQDQNYTTAIDMCGTGGDKLNTFNISTAASFVVAAAGGIVAKHGNRSSSGIFGSADIFEYFGYNLDADPSKLTEILSRYNITFIFAPKFHPAIKHASAARRQLSRKTAFNILGPLSNPARVKKQLVGVHSVELLNRIPNILQQRGAQSIIAVRSDNGMDEFSTAATNRVCILQNGKIKTDLIDPEDVRLHKSKLKDIQIKTKDDAILSFVKVINGSANRTMIETVALNAAAGLVVGGVVQDIREGVELALDTITGGDTIKLLEQFVIDTGDVARLREVI